MGHSFWLAARVLLDALSHKQDSTYHGLSYTALAGMRNSSMGPPIRDRSDDSSHYKWTLYHRATSCSLVYIFTYTCTMYTRLKHKLGTTIFNR